MEHEPIGDDELEDGEISNSDDGYTPLQRPTNSTGGSQLEGGISDMTSTTVSKMDEASEQDSLPEPSSDSSESESGFQAKTKMSKLRIKSHNNRDDRNTHHKPRKYNIWTSSLQEESLLENLKGCGVDKSSTSFDRNIESYDYSLKYRLNGENSLKRRQSNSDDSDKTFGNFQRRTKRFRSNNLQERNRKNVRLRLGNKSDDSSSNDGLMNQPRIILDLTISADTTSENVARQIANNLYEEKDDLMVRIVQILGTEIPIELFEETKRIENEGGMLVLNRMRRRTPGGVFLFLLKNSDKIKQEDKTKIFSDETKKQIKQQKSVQAMQRDRKVAELKKTLRKENNELSLNSLATRSDLVLSSHLSAETHTNLSNPPPSPVTDCNRENSSDFDTNDIQHVNVTSPEKVFSKNDSAKSYEDDFLDVNCDPMDLF